MSHKIIIAGGSGFLGKAIVNYFSQKDAQFILLGRGAAYVKGSVKQVQWDGTRLGDWAKELENADCLVNLTGKSVDCRYNEKNKAEIFRSRLDSTNIIAKAIQGCKNPPKVWINAASATIYRHAEDRQMDEYTGEIGHGFSVEVCKAWEKVFNEAAVPQTRKAVLRVAIVLGKEGGVMRPLKNLVRFGLGGKMGKGTQFFSWIHERDFVSMIEWIMQNPKASGTFNCAAPQPTTNAELMRLLRKNMGMPFGMPQPVWLLKLGALLIGTETELILKSRNVIPKKLTGLGFRFKCERAEEAIRDLLQK